MNPSPHAKAELFEMRLRKIPRGLTTLAKWYLRHHFMLKFCIVAGVFLMVSRWQYQAEINGARLANAALKKQVAALKVFSDLPDKTFIVRAKSMDDLYSIFEQIEHAAIAKRAEAKAALEERQK